VDLAVPENVGRLRTHSFDTTAWWIAKMRGSGSQHKRGSARLVRMGHCDGSGMRTESAGSTNSRRW
jgi:hypothetical protein